MKVNKKISDIKSREDDRIGVKKICSMAKTKYLIYFFFSILLTGIIPSLTLAIRQTLIDNVLLLSDFLWPVLMYVALIALNTLLNLFNIRVTERLNMDIEESVHLKRLKKCASIPYTVLEREETRKLLFFSEHFPEDVLKGIKSLTLFLSETLKSICLLITISLYDLPIGLLICLFTACTVFFSVLNSKKELHFWQKYRETMRRSKYVSSLLINREYTAEKKLFGFFGAMQHRFDEAFEQAKKVNQHHALSRLKVDSVVEISNILFLIISFFLLLNAFLSGSLTIGALTSIFFALVGFFGSTKIILNALFESLQMHSQLKEWEHFLNLEEVRTIEKKEVIASKSFERITFNSVVFSYPDSERTVLNGVSFKLKRGKHYSLVGENGSGKSTIVKLLLGLYEPLEGEILLNDSPVKAYGSEELSRRMAVVFQDFNAYPLSIEENVRIGALEKSGNTENLFELFKTLGLDEKIQQLPLKEQTVLNHLNSESSSLSLGQLQKLSIARMLYADRELVILDEPNAALDPISEERLYNTYRKILKDKTTLFISHRLGSVGLSDEVLVLRDGRITAHGTHRELMVQKGYYYDLYTRQLELYNEEV